MSALEHLLDAYLAGPRTLRDAVAGMSREHLTARPVPGKWSTLEVVCHLADFEPIYADRIKRCVAEDRPDYLSADEERFAAALAYQERDLDEELAIIDNTRRQLARVLRAQPEGVLARVGVYRHAGGEEVRTIERLLTTITNHIPHHAKFIAEKRRALGLSA
jgi:uncharacterized damage-inducible protein DinB